MDGLFLLFAALGLALAVVLGTRLIVRALPRNVRTWARLPVAALLLALPFADELYNERQTQLACAADGGLVVRKLVTAHSVDAGMALIETRRLDSEMSHFWRHDLVFVFRPTGEVLGRLRWFDRKGGWLRGNRPGRGFITYFTPSPCPDPQPLLAGGAARRQLVHPLQD
jgi:hypothetical protein